MKEVVGIQEVLENWNRWLVIDVRSPGEYIAGHIPGAINIPLFSDDERARVGTLYTQTSPEAAMQAGLDIAGGKLSHLLEQVKPFRQTTDGKKILLHCWRGGKRSQAVQWLYNFSGLSVSLLDGGYKQFRHALHTFFNSGSIGLNILGGCTGAGKTEVLYELASRGQQIIDLERHAHHKGSAFGSIGEPDQPTTEQFENNLFLSFLALDPSQPVWVENESRSIGRAHLPEGLWNHMRASPLYTITVDMDVRLDRILKYYAEPGDLERLKASFTNIQKRIGGLDYQTAMSALDVGDLKTAAIIALRYYDKTYLYQLDQWSGKSVYHLPLCNDPARIAEQLIEVSIGIGSSS